MEQSRVLKMRDLLESLQEEGSELVEGREVTRSSEIAWPVVLSLPSGIRMNMSSLAGLRSDMASRLDDKRHHSAWDKKGQTLFNRSLPKDALAVLDKLDMMEKKAGQKATEEGLKKLDKWLGETDEVVRGLWFLWRDMPLGSSDSAVNLMVGRLKEMDVAVGKIFDGMKSLKKMVKQVAE